MLRLVTYGPSGAESIGALMEDGIRPLDAFLAESGVDAADDRAVVGALALIEREVASGSDRRRIPVADVRLGPPIRRPGKIIEIGFNTHSLLAALGAQPFAEPPLYAKASGTIVGPADPVVTPRTVRKLDYEVELAAVIGRRCKEVDVDGAMDVVAGFTVANDVTARDVQLGESESGRYHRQNYRSKSFDTFCPTGPCLYVPDEQERGRPFVITSRVNGELRQSGTTDDLVWSIPQVVAFASASMTLEPGDMILTGGLAGSGYVQSPQTFLKPGDRVIGSIERIGSIDNLVM